MHTDVNGMRLWFDVDGPALVPDGSELRQRPTVVLVHGGPGVYDHSYFKPDFALLAGHAQVVYLDLRGHGRSAWGDAAAWSFEACADDVRGFCDTVGIDRPIVFGHSMGGPIVLLYGARHPGHAAGLIVQSGFARWDPARMVEGFRRVAGDEVAEIAGRSGLASLPPSASTSRTKSERLLRPRISTSTPTGWSSSANSTSSISYAGSTLRRWYQSASSTP
jgi:pimeloyl-ACP methyl ester carboxylesterase